MLFSSSIFSMKCKIWIQIRMANFMHPPVSIRLVGFTPSRLFKRLRTPDVVKLNLCQVYNVSTC